MSDTPQNQIGQSAPEERRGILERSGKSTLKERGYVRCVGSRRGTSRLGREGGGIIGVGGVCIGKVWVSSWKGVRRGVAHMEDIRGEA